MIIPEKLLSGLVKSMQEKIMYENPSNSICKICVCIWKYLNDKNYVCTCFHSIFIEFDDKFKKFQCPWKKIDCFSSAFTSDYEIHLNGALSNFYAWNFCKHYQNTYNLNGNI